jgi:hypothetical protein
VRCSTAHLLQSVPRHIGAGLLRAHGSTAVDCHDCTPRGRVPFARTYDPSAPRSAVRRARRGQSWQHPREGWRADVGRTPRDCPLRCPLPFARTYDPSSPRSAVRERSSGQWWELPAQRPLFRCRHGVDPSERLTPSDSHRATHTERLTPSDSHRATHTERLTPSDSHRATHTERLTFADRPTPQALNTSLTITRQKKGEKS